MFFCSKKGQFTYLAKMRFAKITSVYFFFMLWGISFTASAQLFPPSQYKDSPTDVEIPTEEQLFKDDPDPVVLSAQIAVRLKKIQQTIPLDYNEHVQKYISYNTNEKRKTHVAKMLGRSKKFFPIFEPILAKYGIPDEMKYLAVVESALNPFAVSKMGATGPWQFMYSTALRYDLTISKRIDERRDPYAACEAAAKYLKEMYNLYGSWHLAIASYNCGAGNVNKAIKKAHAPQVAAQAAHHLLIRKQVVKGQTRTDVTLLDKKARQDELARMLSGAEITDEARSAAKRLMG